MDLEDAVNFLCLGLPTRETRAVDKGINEWMYAETAAFVQFRSDFLSRFPGGIVLNQLTYKTISVPQDQGIQFVLDALDVYFRNWWSPKNMSREGGFRKPDGLGISSGGQVIEIIEVKPAKNYSDGVDQLNEMIAKVQSGLDDHYKDLSILNNVSPSYNPLFTTVKASPWKPTGWGMSIPLVSGDDNEIAWVCFKPTRRALPTGTTPIDGVILYEIHNLNQLQQMQGMRVPKEMAQRLANAHADRIRSGSLKLLPWADSYTMANPEDAQFMKALAIGAAAGVAVLCIAMAIVAAGPALAAVFAEAAVETETVEILVGGGYRVAPTVVRVSVAEYEAAESAEALIEASRMARLP